MPTASVPGRRGDGLRLLQLGGQRRGLQPQQRGDHVDVLPARLLKRRDLRRRSIRPLSGAEHLQVRREPVPAPVRGDIERLLLLLQRRLRDLKFALRPAEFQVRPGGLRSHHQARRPRRSAAAACSFALAASTPRRVPPNTSTTHAASKPTVNRLSSRCPRPGS